jgi:hypothetical protein
MDGDRPMKPPENRHFVNPDIFYQTYDKSSKGFSKEKYSTYGEARKIVDEDRQACDQKGIESVLSVTWFEDPKKHYKIMGELIKSYQKSDELVEDPVVVMVHQTKEYRILAASEATPALWLKKPYATYGPMEPIEKLVKRYQGLDLLEKSSFKASDY